MTRRLLGRRGRRTAATGIAALSLLAASTLSAVLLVSSATPSHSAEITGNIGSKAIEIDANANLYPGGPTAACPTPDSPIDWVRDCSANTDTTSVVDSVATGVQVGVTGAAKTGHWYGTRIVDGIATADQNIFLTGGKEQNPGGWNVGPGSVGSAKYDITQAYLANNSDDVFFGMERRGNNGTTAFDFEFNQKAPTTNAQGSEVPVRSLGDVLLTFEMQGSGNTGSAVPHYYKHDGTLYIEEKTLPAGILSTINTTAVPAAPWGYVNSQGNWVLGNLDRFSFAEARVALDLLDPSGTFDPCTGAERFVQVRTRSSAVDTSDLKDTTEVFKYTFFSPQQPATNLSSDCAQRFTYSTTGTSANWTFTVPSTSGATLSGGGVSAGASPKTYTSTSTSGTVDVALPAGEESVTIAAAQTASDANGCSASSSGSITVFRTLSATASLGAKCDNRFDYSSTVSGGKGPYTYAWSFQRNTGTAVAPEWTEVGTSTTASGTFVAPDLKEGGTYKADLTVRDTPDTGAGQSGKPVCTATASATTTVFDQVGGSLVVTPDCDPSFTFATSATGGNGSYTYAWSLQKQQADGTYTTVRTGTTSSGTIDVSTGTPALGEGVYKMVMTVKDTQGLDPECQVVLTSAPFTVLNALTVTAAKAADDSRTTVTMTATPSSTTGPVTYQWARLKADGTYEPVAGQTGAVYAGYGDFETHGTAASVTHTIDGDTYLSKVYSVQFRVTASRTLNGQLCTDTATVVVKKVIGVDP